jgi:hypothetical protein
MEGWNLPTYKCSRVGKCIHTYTHTYMHRHTCKIHIGLYLNVRSWNWMWQYTHTPVRIVHEVIVWWPVLFLGWHLFLSWSKSVLCISWNPRIHKHVQKNTQLTRSITLLSSYVSCRGQWNNKSFSYSYLLSLGLNECNLQILSDLRIS